ncbi:MAG: hypothetical protein ACLP62_01005 [Acidimicrobiales bacterium]
MQAGEDGSPKGPATLSRLFDEWLDHGRRTRRWAEQSGLECERKADKSIRPSLGGIKLAKLTA